MGGTDGCAMLIAMDRWCAVDVDTEELPELPELDIDDGEGQVDEHGGIDLRLPEPDGDPDDKPPADDLVLEVELHDTHDEPSALDDDATGIADAPSTLGLSLTDRTESLLGTDGDLGCGDDEALGISELPEDDDPSDAEGLDDPGGSQVNTRHLPVLETNDDGDEEIDVGLDISEPPVEPGEDDSEE